MPNTYYKILNNAVKKKYNENLIGDIQRDLSRSVKMMNDNLYDEISELKNTENIDIEILLKYYAISQILKDTKSEHLSKKQKNENIVRGLESTANPNFKKDSNLYYRIISDDSIEPMPDIKYIFEDGSYSKEKRLSFSAYILITRYNIEDIVIAMQLIDPGGTVVDNKHYAAEILGMRKEYIQRFKYSGFSGNSNDILAAVANKVCSPIESGYYIDKHFHFYRWSDKQKMFIRNTKLELYSPLLTDYVFDGGKKGIRKEYTGT